MIQGRAYRPDDAEAAAAKTEKGDLGVEVARLNYAIDDVTRQLRQEVRVLQGVSVARLLPYHRVIWEGRPSDYVLGGPAKLSKPIVMS